MTKWEYLFLSRHPLGSPDELEKDIEEAGETGWEMVSCQWSGYTIICAVFKREKI